MAPPVGWRSGLMECVPEMCRSRSPASACCERVQTIAPAAGFIEFRLALQRMDIVAVDDVERIGPTPCWVAPLRSETCSGPTACEASTKARSPGCSVSAVADVSGADLLPCQASSPVGVFSRACKREHRLPGPPLDPALGRRNRPVLLGSHRAVHRRAAADHAARARDVVAQARGVLVWLLPSKVGEPATTFASVSRG